MQQVLLQSALGASGNIFKSIVTALLNKEPLAIVLCVLCGVFVISSITVVALLIAHSVRNKKPKASQKATQKVTHKEKGAKNATMKQPKNKVKSTSQVPEAHQVALGDGNMYQQSVQPQYMMQQPIQMGNGQELTPEQIAQLINDPTAEQLSPIYVQIPAPPQQQPQVVPQYIQAPAPAPVMVAPAPQPAPVPAPAPAPTAIPINIALTSAAEQAPAPQPAPAPAPQPAPQPAPAPVAAAPAPAPAPAPAAAPAQPQVQSVLQPIVMPIMQQPMMPFMQSPMMPYMQQPMMPPMMPFMQSPMMPYMQQPMMPPMMPYMQQPMMPQMPYMQPMMPQQSAYQQSVPPCMQQQPMQRHMVVQEPVIACPQVVEHRYAGEQPVMRQVAYPVAEDGANVKHVDFRPVQAAKDGIPINIKIEVEGAGKADGVYEKFGKLN